MCCGSDSIELNLWDDKPNRHRDQLHSTDVVSGLRVFGNGKAVGMRSKVGFNVGHGLC